jgi:phosphatidate phosphatase APP1
MLNKFLEHYQFPEGSLYLRTFRIKDSSFFDFLKPSTKYKILTITKLMKQFPERDFILIGDSGEHDPEVYAAILKKFTEQVKKIYIRKVSGSDLSEQRFKTAYKGLAQSKLVLFSELDALPTEYCLK